MSGRSFVGGHSTEFVSIPLVICPTWVFNVLSESSGGEFSLELFLRLAARRGGMGGGSLLSSLLLSLSINSSTIFSS